MADTAVPSRTEAQTKKWQADMLVKRVLRFDEELVHIVSSSFDYHCELEFLSAIRTLSQAKANEITRVIRQNHNEFQNRMDFIAEQASNLQMTSITAIQHQFLPIARKTEEEEEDEEITSCAAYKLAQETSLELDAVRDQISQLEHALEWQAKQREISQLVEAKNFTKAQEVYSQLHVELSVHNRDSLFAQKLQVPNVSKHCETLVLQQWMPKAMDMGKQAGAVLCSRISPRAAQLKLPNVESASVLHYANRNRENRTKYKAQRLVLFRQLKLLPDALGFIWLEENVGLFSRGERRELWLELEHRFGYNTTSKRSGEEPLQFAHFLDKVRTVECSPRLLAEFSIAWPTIQENAFQRFSTFCASKLTASVNAFQDLSAELQQVDADLRTVSTWLGLNSSKSKTLGVLGEAISTSLQETGDVKQIITLFQLCQDFALTETENSCREQLERVFISAQLAPVVLGGATLPSLMETKIEPHACVVKLMKDLETSQQMLPRQVQALIVSQTVSRLIERLETVLFGTPHQKFNPLLLKLFLLDVRLIALNFPTHEQLEDLSSVLQLFCQDQALGAFVRQETATARKSEVAELIVDANGSSGLLEDGNAEMKQRAIHILERFQEMDSNSRLFGSKDLQKQIVDLRQGEAQRYLEALRFKI